MNNTCPKCGSVMVEKPPEQIYCSYPPQWDSVMWCGCGYTEERGRVYGMTPEQSLYNSWKEANRGQL
jgi:hypothetical protein